MRVNRAVLSEILGVSEAGLTSWADQGMPVVRDGRGTEWEADPADCVAWLLQRERDRIAATGPVSEQRARLLRAQADKAELDARQRAGELVLVRDVANEVGRALRVVRDRVLGVPDRVAPMLASVSDTAAVHAMLRAELVGALEACVLTICAATATDDAANLEAARG